LEEIVGKGGICVQKEGDSAHAEGFIEAEGVIARSSAAEDIVAFDEVLNIVLSEDFLLVGAGP